MGLGSPGWVLCSRLAVPCWAACPGGVHVRPPPALSPGVPVTRVGTRPGEEPWEQPPGRLGPPGAPRRGLTLQPWGGRGACSRMGLGDAPGMLGWGPGDAPEPLGRAARQAAGCAGEGAAAERGGDRGMPRGAWGGSGRVLAGGPGLRPAGAGKSGGDARGEAGRWGGPRGRGLGGTGRAGLCRRAGHRQGHGGVGALGGHWDEH